MRRCAAPSARNSLLSSLGAQVALPSWKNVHLSRSTFSGAMVTVQNALRCPTTLDSMCASSGYNPSRHISTSGSKPQLVLPTGAGSTAAGGVNPASGPGAGRDPQLPTQQTDSRHAFIPKAFREKKDDFDLLDFPSNTPQQEERSSKPSTTSTASSSTNGIPLSASDIPQRVMMHHLTEFKREHPNATPKQIEAFIRRLEARYAQPLKHASPNASSAGSGVSAKSTEQLQRERLALDQQAYMSASIAARSGGENPPQGGAQSPRLSVAELRAQRELNMMRGHAAGSSASGHQYGRQTGQQQHIISETESDFMDISDITDYDSETSGRPRRLKGAHGTVTKDGTRILDTRGHEVAEGDDAPSSSEDPQFMDFLAKAGQLDTAFKHSRFNHYFDPAYVKPHPETGENVSETESYIARMKHGEPVYFVGSRRVISSDGSVDETAYMYMIRQLDMRNLHIHDFVVSADFDTGMPFEADVYSHISSDRTSAQVIERDEDTGEIRHRTFIRLHGSPWKWTGAMAISRAADSIMKKVQELENTGNISYTLSRVRFAPFHHYSEKLVRENGETILTIFDELAVTSEAQYRGATTKLYESIKESMAAEGLNPEELEDFSTKGGQMVDYMTSEDSRMAKPGAGTMDIVNEILTKYKDSGAEGLEQVMKELEQLPDVLGEDFAEGGPGNGAGPFTDEQLQSIQANMFDERKAARSSKMTGDKKKQKRRPY